MMMMMMMMMRMRMMMMMLKMGRRRRRRRRTATATTATTTTTTTDDEQDDADDVDVEDSHDADDADATDADDADNADDANVMLVDSSSLSVDAPLLGPGHRDLRKLMAKLKPRDRPQSSAWSWNTWPNKRFRACPSWYLLDQKPLGWFNVNIHLCLKILYLSGLFGDNHQKILNNSSLAACTEGWSSRSTTPAIWWRVVRRETICFCPVGQETNFSTNARCFLEVNSVGGPWITHIWFQTCVSIPTAENPRRTLLRFSMGPGEWRDGAESRLECWLLNVVASSDLFSPGLLVSEIVQAYHLIASQTSHYCASFF